MELDMPKARALVIAPDDADGEQVRTAVRHALEEAGVETFRLDSLTGASLGYETMRAILAADLIVADLTRHNPSVLYNLGYAHAFQRRTILLRSTESPPSDLPSELEGSFYIPYDPRNLEKLKKNVHFVALKHTECGVER